MKRHLTLILIMALLSVVSVRGQDDSAPKPTSKAELPAPIEAPADKRFDLDFPGGTTREFVKAVEKALGRELNVYIADEYKNFKLPAMKMRKVTVPQLFNGLANLSRKRGQYISGYVVDGRGKRAQYSDYSSMFGFMSGDKAATENSIWWFYHEGGPPPADMKELIPSVRYWNLSPYLDQFKVEDITTAVETGWKMQGEESKPKLSFHKDTKLLIGAGDYQQLNNVDEVLRNLAASIDQKPRVPSPPPSRSSN